MTGTTHESIRLACVASTDDDAPDEPPRSLEDPREILLLQLSSYRATLLSKLDGLSEDQLTTSILPSGWSPLGLLKHLVFGERRWMQWGFQAEQVPDPWGDHDPSTLGWILAHLLQEYARHVGHLDVVREIDGRIPRRITPATVQDHREEASPAGIEVRRIRREPR